MVGRVDFLDAGESDPKWVLSTRPLSPSQVLWLRWFFRFYALCKGPLNAIAGRRGRNAMLGLQVFRP